MREQEFSGEVKVIINGGLLNINSNITAMGELKSGDQIVVQMTSNQTDIKFYGLNVDEKTKNIVFKKNIGSEVSTDKNVVAYQKKVTVLGTEFPYTKADQNCLTILETQNNGKVRYWELSLINQNEKFYFIVQKVYEAQCFKTEEDKIICPYFRTNKHWPQLVELLRNLYYEKEKIPLYTTTILIDDNDLFILTGNEGSVLWWNFRRNSGVIMTNKGPVKVYWKNIKSDKTPVYLISNKFVKFESLISPTHRTELEWEAIGVEMPPQNLYDDCV